MNSNLLNTSGFFFQSNDPSLILLKNEIVKGIKENVMLSQYDQYARYYYKEGFSAKEFFIKRIEILLFLENGDWIFFYEFTSSGPYLIGVRLSRWDEKHFNFKMASLQIFTVPNQSSSNEKLKKNINKVVSYLKKQSVVFVSSRVNGDHINALHAMEDVGFRYYDNVVWPITNAANQNTEANVRLIKADETDTVKWLAKNFQYPRGHYYCDDRFDKKVINDMYAKWIDTTLSKNEPIAVIESEEKVVGFFVFKIDEELYKYTGYKYGRLKLLALNTKERGKGLGDKLFKGTLSIIKNMGVDFIDSGYSTKNHISAKLHTKNSFFSVHEEVTFHLWLK